MMDVVSLLLYGASGAAYTVHFIGRGAAAGRFATTSLVAAVLTHTFVIGMQTVRIGYLPFTSTAGAVSIFVWLLALAYLYTEMTADERAMGVFIVPLLVVLQAVSIASSQPGERPAVLEGPWFGVHVASLLCAYASLALACVLGITYVLLFKELKGKHLTFFYSRLPSLQRLDSMNVRAVTIGWIFLTVGVIAGGIWLFEARAEAAPDPRIQAMSLFDPKISLALVSWALYSFELYASRVIGWHGRKTAWLSTIGFVLVLLNFVPIGYFLTESHAF